MASRRSRPKQKQKKKRPNKERGRATSAAKPMDPLERARIDHGLHGTKESLRALAERLVERMERLREQGETEAARSHGRELLEAGVPRGNLRKRIRQALIRLEMIPDAVRLKTKTDDELVAAVADQLTRNPEAELPRKLEHLRGEARIVSAAFAELEAGRDEAALDRLRAIPRRSYFADWRLLARGLVSWRARDDERAAACWDRLETARDPGRIARRVRRIGRSEATDEDRRAAARLEAATLEQPVLEPLLELESARRAQRWPTAADALRDLDAPLRALDPEMPGRLTRALHPDLLADAAGRHRGGHKKLGDIKRVLGRLERLPADPTWDRFWALAAEHGEDPFEGTTAAACWRRYRQSLDRVAPLRDDQRPLGEAIVLSHAGGHCLIKTASFLARVGHHREASRRRAEGIELCREAIRVCPSYPGAHRVLVEGLEEAERTQEAFDARDGLLEAAPDDRAARTEAINRLWANGELARAEGHARAVLDTPAPGPELARAAATAFVAAARQAAIEGRFADAESAMDRASKVDPSRDGQIDRTVKRALIAWRARGEAAADDVLAPLTSDPERALPTALLLALETERFELGPTARARFRAELHDALSAREQPPAAMAEAATWLVSYGRAGHVPDLSPPPEEALVSLLERSRLQSFRPDELDALCRFLIELIDGPNTPEAVPGLLLDLGRRGRDADPHAPRFPLACALAGHHGAPGCPEADIAGYAEDAFELARDRTDEDARWIAQRAHHVLMELDAEGPGIVKGLIDALAGELGLDPAEMASELSAEIGADRRR